MSDTNDEKEQPKSNLGFILKIIVVLLLISAVISLGFYFYHRIKQQPADTVTAYLEAAEKCDLTLMESLVQSNDYSVLNNADINDEDYEELFRQLNSHMSFTISNTRLNIQEGSAIVTAHIKYLDGTEIYQSAANEFLNAAVDDVFSDSEKSTDTSDAKAAVIEQLTELMNDSSAAYTERDIIYPLIKTDEGWRLTVLDKETIMIMSGGVISLQDMIKSEINSTDSDAEDSSDQDNEDAEDDNHFKIDSDTFSINYTNHTLGTDFEGKPCLFLYYDYTNNGDIPSSALVDVDLDIYQHGKILSPAIPAKKIAAVDRYYKEVQPGETINVCQVFSLTDKSSVTVQLNSSFSFGDTNIHSQILNLV